MTDMDEAELDRLEGLWNASDRGEWIAGHFASDEHSCQCKSVLSDNYMGAVCTVHADDEDGGEHNPTAAEAKAHLAFIADVHNAFPELIAAARALPAERRAREKAESILRNVVSHATMGAISDCKGVGLNDICCTITALRNDLRRDAREAAEARATAAEQRVKALEEALGALGNGATAVGAKFQVVQPFFAIWAKHGPLIEECIRGRSTLEDKSND